MACGSTLWVCEAYQCFRILNISLKEILHSTWKKSCPQDVLEWVDCDFVAMLQVPFIILVNEFKYLMSLITIFDTSKPEILLFNKSFSWKDTIVKVFLHGFSDRKPMIQGFFWWTFY